MQRHTQKAFSIIELTVVIAIVAIMAVMAIGMLTVLQMEDGINATMAEVRGAIEKGRAQGAARGSRFEVIVDYENNQIRTLERLPLYLNTMEPFDRGTTGVDFDFGVNEVIEPERAQHQGYARASGRAGFEIPWSAKFGADPQRDGVSLSFDLYLQYSTSIDRVLVSQGNWSLTMKPGKLGRTATFSARNGGTVIPKHLVSVPIGQWVNIRVTASPIMLSLSIDGVTESVINKPDAFTPPDTGQNGVAFAGLGTTRDPWVYWIDNLRLDRVTVASDSRVEEGFLLPPGILDSAYLLPAQQLEFLERAANLNLFVGDSGPGAIPVGQQKPELAPTAIDRAQPVQFIDQVPVRQSLIFFNETGQLDDTFHSGEAQILFVQKPPEGQFNITALNISLSGVVSERPLATPMAESEALANARITGSGRPRG